MKIKIWGVPRNCRDGNCSSVQYCSEGHSPCLYTFIEKGLGEVYKEDIRRQYTLGLRNYYSFYLEIRNHSIEEVEGTIALLKIKYSIPHLRITIKRFRYNRHK